MFDAPAIVVRFDRRKIDAGTYGIACWQLFWEAVSPESLFGVNLFEGDSPETLNGTEDVYCLGFQTMIPAMLEVIRQGIRSNPHIQRALATPPLVEGRTAAGLLFNVLPESGMINGGQISGGRETRNPAAALRQRQAQSTPPPAKPDKSGEHVPSGKSGTVIHVQCANCKRKFVAQEGLVGKRLPCPSCSHEIFVSRPPVVAQSPSMTTSPFSPTQPVQAHIQPLPNANPKIQPSSGETTKVMSAAVPNAAPAHMPPTIGRPRIVVAYRIFSALMLAMGLLCAGIGLSLYSARSKMQSQPHYGGPGSQRLVYHHSSEQARAPLYVMIGLGQIAACTVAFLLPICRFTYVYLTTLLPLSLLGFGNIISVVFVPILCIWWFRKYNRTYFGFGAHA